MNAMYMLRFPSSILFAFFLLISVYSQKFQWEHLKGPNGGIIGDIRADSKGTLFAGTYLSRGLFRSYDGGETWERLEYAFDEFQVYSIYISPEDHIYVGNNYGHKIYLSTDGGDTWSTSSEGYATNECWTLSRTGDSIMTAGDGEFGGIWRSTNRGKNWVRTGDLNIRPIDIQATPSGIFLCGSHDGLLRSSDQGITWQRIQGMQGFAVPDFLIVHDSLIYCGSGYYANGNGIFRSTDGGLTWQPAGLNNGTVVLAVEQFSNGDLIAGTKNIGLYTSTDDGMTWQPGDSLLRHHEVFRITVLNDTIYNGTDSHGIFTSHDRGQNFKLIGLPISSVSNFLLNDDELITSTPNGIQIYSFFNKQWRYDGLNGTPIIRQSPSGALYSQDENYYIYTKQAGAVAWEKGNRNADTSLFKDLVFISDSILITNSLTLQKSTDAGESWSKIAGGVGKAINLYNGTEFIVQIFNNFQGKIYKSIDTGKTFQVILDRQLDNDFVNGIAVWNDWIMIADGIGPLTSNYLSTNGGITWKSNIQTGPYRFYLFKIFNSIIYGGGPDGLFMSSDTGNTWIQIFNIGNYTSISDISLYENKLVVSLRGRGVYMSSPITSLKDYENPLSGAEIELDAYPNPGNSSINLSIKLPPGSPAELRIYNAVGELIGKTNFEAGHSGNLQHMISGYGLSSGVYYCQLLSGRASMTRKIVFMK